MAPKNNERFARMVTEAFSALGVTQAEFKRLGGPSDTTLRKIMDGEPVGIAARTLKGLDTAFNWSPGSAARTLVGGVPQPDPLSRETREAKSRHFNEVRERVGEIYDDMQRRKAESNDESSTPAILPSADGEPTIVHATRLLWNRIVDLVDSPDGDLQRQDKADRVVIVAADVIADVLLGLNAGTPAKPLIEEMFTRATLAAQRRQARTTTEGGQDGLESASQSAASSPVDKSKKNPDELADEGESASARLGAAVEVGRPKLQVEDVSEDA